MARNQSAKKPSPELLKVEEARKALGVSRRRLAREAGVSDAAISKALAGRGGLGVRGVERLVAAVERLSLSARLRRDRLNAIIEQERNAA